MIALYARSRYNVVGVCGLGTPLTSRRQVEAISMNAGVALFKNI